MNEDVKRLNVYCETTVISDMTSRPSLLVVNLARQIVTREWWKQMSPHSVFYVSQLVEIEVSRGDDEAAKRRREFLSGLDWLEYGTEALALAKKFLDAAAIPETSFDDATHVAIATIAKMDCLATWNCRHINNPETLPTIIRVCEDSGYKCPLIGTPEQLREVYHG